MDLNIPQVTIPDYDPDILEIVAGKVTPELHDLKVSLKAFLRRSAKYYSVGILASFLGTNSQTIRHLMTAKDYTNINTSRAQTILVLKPLDEAEGDFLKYQAGRL